jgi:hypothetical protein
MILGGETCSTTKTVLTGSWTQCTGHPSLAFSLSSNSVSDAAFVQLRRARQTKQQAVASAAWLVVVCAAGLRSRTSERYGLRLLPDSAFFVFRGDPVLFLDFPPFFFSLHVGYDQETIRHLCHNFRLR